MLLAKEPFVRRVGVARNARQESAGGGDITCRADGGAAPDRFAMALAAVQHDEDARARLAVRAGSRREGDLGVTQYRPSVTDTEIGGNSGGRPDGPPPRGRESRDRCIAWTGRTPLYGVATMPTSESHPHSRAAGTDAAHLLEHLDWVSGLARRLARDESSADDLVQRTLLSALRWPSKASQANPRAWLRRVLTNEAKRTWRTEIVRRDREDLAIRERPREVPDPADVEERFELQRELVDVVDSLAEPYRTAILLRYFEGMTPTEIAAQQGVPIHTVTSRLARARGQLRDRLDRSHGSRAAWTAAFVRLPGVEPSAVLPAMGESFASSAAASSVESTARLAGLTPSPLALFGTSLAMKVLLVTATLVGLCLLVYSTLGGPLAAQGASLATRSATRDVGGARPELGVKTGARDRVEGGELSMAAQVDAHVESQLTHSEPLVVTGLVVDAEGRPCPGVSFRREPSATSNPRPEVMESDAAGAVAFTLDPSAMESPFCWVSASPDWATLVTTEIDADFVEARSSVFIAVAPTERLRGVVVNRSGQPVAAAAVTLSLPEGFRSRFDSLLAGTVDREWKTTSGDDGCFEFAHAPRLDDAVVQAQAFGHLHAAAVDVAEAREWAADDPESRLRLVLVALDPDRAVHGVVLDASGLPIRGASVAFGRSSSETALDGTFRFHLDGIQMFDAPPTSLVVAHRRYRPTTITPPVGPTGDADWPPFVEVRLGEVALTIAGRVRDGSGAAVAGARVWITDVTYLGRAPNGELRVAESVARGDQEFWHSVVSDGDGRFSLDGLSDRVYRLRALAPGTVQMTPATEVAAGTSDAELRFTADEDAVPLKGRVVDLAGRSLAGVKVRASRESFRVTMWDRTKMARAYTEPVFTDEDGDFELSGVPIVEGVFIGLDLEGFAGRHVARTALDFEDDVAVLTLVREAHVRIRLAADDADIDRVSFLDAAGECVLFHQHNSGSRFYQRYVVLANGESQTLVVPGNAVSVEYRMGDERLHVLPLELDFDQLNVLSR